jgi:Calcineurin-like phosphoesterase
MAKAKYTTARPLNVNVRPGSPVATLCRSYAGLPGKAPEGKAIAPGLPPTPAQDLRFRGGKTIADLTFTNVYIGGDQAWDHNDRQSIDKALAAAMSDKNLNNVMMQYFDNQTITSTFKASTVLSGSPPDTVSQGDVESLLRQLHSQGTLGSFDLASTVFDFMLPRNTVLTDDAQSTHAVAGRHAALAGLGPTPTTAIPHEDQASSLLGLGGYHGSIHIGQMTLYYAVGVYSEKRDDGSTNGIPAFDQPWKNVVATFYHELNEARTDPDVEDAIRAGNDPSATRFLGWTSDQGEECGDFPIDEATSLALVFKEVPLADGSGTVPIQFQYSNAVHGPEGPIPVPHDIARAATATTRVALRARFARASGSGPNPGELLPFKPSIGDAVMVLDDFFPPQTIQGIQKRGSIAFHAIGDSGVGTPEQHAVADAMSLDLKPQNSELGPAFLLHLGDIIYGPDKTARYANRFYRPNDNYPNLIFAIPGNHDGEVRSTQDHSSLEAFFVNFCQPKGKQPTLGVSFGRSMPNQPGAYWRLKCPFVEIVGLYSGTGENYGAIAHPEIGDQQKIWLAKALETIAMEPSKSKKALIIAVHHPPYARGLMEGGFGHPGNPDMLKDIDDCCKQAGVWPDLVLSAHAHNYQRYMRTLSVNGAERTIPYLISGGGGIGPQSVAIPLGTLSADGTVRYVNALQSHGYLTVTISATQLTTAFTRTDNTTRTAFETITIDLATSRQV